MKALAIVAVLFLLGGAVIFAQTKSPQPISAVGRFQVVCGPNEPAFLLDTQTGRTWTELRITSLKDEPVIWVPRERVDSPEEFKRWNIEKLTLEREAKQPKP
jgi:hypothetical protein